MGDAGVDDLLAAAQSNGFVAHRINQIVAETSRGKGTLSDLFDLIDIDKDGTITLEEFQITMRRLGFHLSQHRLAAVLSKCLEARTTDKTAQDKGTTILITEAEFKGALNYLVKEVMQEQCLSGLGVSKYAIVKS